MGCPPVTTGEMLKGRSSMLMTSVLPQNSLLTSRIAKVTPKAVFMGTATTASMRVNLTCAARECLTGKHTCRAGLGLRVHRQGRDLFEATQKAGCSLCHNLLLVKHKCPKQEDVRS